MTRHIASLIRRHPAVMRLPCLMFRRLQARYTVGAVAVVIDSRRRVLIVEHLLHPQRPWGLPGGWIGHNEDPSAAIVRELREELQLKADTVKVLHIAKSVRNHIDIAFLCQAQSPVGKLSRELLNHKWVKPDQLPDMRPFHQQSIELAFKSVHRSPPWEQT